MSPCQPLGNCRNPLISPLSIEPPADYDKKINFNYIGHVIYRWIRNFMLITRKIWKKIKIKILEPILG